MSEAAPDSSATAERTAACAARLHERLLELPVAIETVSGSADAIDLPGYPGEPRPTSTIFLHGAGFEGRGEHVGWTADAHRVFLAAAESAVPRSRLSIGELARALGRALPEAYDRAAVEAAAIDLALRQRALTLAGIAEAPAQPVRYVVSFGRSADPMTDVLREPRARSGQELKLDVDPAWSDETLTALARLGTVAVLDWKGSGDPAAHARFHRAFPDALVEDPALDRARGAAAWPESLLGRLSFDQLLARATDVDAFPVEPAAVNVKPARMGGVLEALDAIARASGRGIAIYFGGMFEVGVGRNQLLRLAALLSPTGPNDIAPIARRGVPAARPSRLGPAPETAGFR